MSYNSKYTGAEVESLLDAANGKQDKIEDLDAIRSGAAAGATALQSVPAEYITESELEQKGYLTAVPSEYVTETELTNKGYATTSALNDKVDKVTGKQLSTEDFTTALKTKLQGLINYDDTAISDAVASLQAQINTLVSGNASSAIESFNEIIAFLDGIKDTQDLASIIASIEQQIAGKMDKVTLATVATTGSYNDLSNKPTIPAEQVNADWNATSGKAQILNKPTIPSAVTESTVSGWGFTKNTGTYSKPSGGIPKSDLASAVQTSLGKADTALQPDAISEFVTTDDLAAVAVSGSYNDLVDTPSIENYIEKEERGKFVAAQVNSLYDGLSIFALPSSADGSEHDILVTKNNLKTFNGQSIFGSGNITISGDSGGEKEVIHTTSAIELLQPNKIYIYENSEEFEIQALEEPETEYAEYHVIFSTPSETSLPSVILPANVMWANGVAPDVSSLSCFELSIVYWVCIGNAAFNSVLTPFNYVE